MEKEYVIDNRPGPVEFEASDYESRTLQNARNLLRLRMGEVPYDRRRGIDPALIDLPAGRAEELIKEEVTRALRWEPDVFVRDARIVVDRLGESYIEVRLMMAEG